tara:strand:+ start:276 stop:560 length:285 start_codon:yes stop_codon:yes gene_type:complete
MINHSDRDWLTNEEVRAIYEHVCGMFSGIRLSGKSRLDVLEDDFWMFWRTDVEVNVWRCDLDNKFNITCYHYKDPENYGNFDDDFGIELEEHWQ